MRGKPLNPDKEFYEFNSCIRTTVFQTMQRVVIGEKKDFSVEDVNTYCSNMPDKALPTRITYFSDISAADDLGGKVFWEGFYSYSQRDFCYLAFIQGITNAYYHVRIKDRENKLAKDEITICKNLGNAEPDYKRDWCLFGAAATYEYFIHNRTKICEAIEGSLKDVRCLRELRLG